MTLLNSPPAKRRKISSQLGNTKSKDPSHNGGLESPLRSLRRSITPPPSNRATPKPTKDGYGEMEPESKYDAQHVKHSNSSEIEIRNWDNKHLKTKILPSAESVVKGKVKASSNTDDQKQPKTKYIRSPFRLTHIRDLNGESNTDTVTLNDFLRDPMIKECWQFNFLFDIDFVMQALDPDVRNFVQVKIVHGFWKNDDTRRRMLEEQAKMYQNVQLITAHMPERFGTHHSKMMVLFRHDDLAQVIIHTANMIKQDWTNLTQGVWHSPLLPLSPNSHPTQTPAPIGCGLRFKRDLLRYLRAYSGRTRHLVSQLEKYDFGAIRAAFIASTPSHIPLNPPKQETSWGWLGLQEILSSTPCSNNLNQEMEENAVVVSQISSIATLGEKWVDNFTRVLSSRQTSQTSNKKKTQIKIIFPTAEEIRRSLDGYASGGSIHMKIQSATQQKQLQLLKPMMCHWSSETDSPAGRSHPRSAALTSAVAMAEAEIPREAHRNRAAPHIKTYIRFRSNAMDAIDWAMLTSANLSQQAWGALTGKDNTIRICSYEVGVVVWPELFLDRPFDTDDIQGRVEEVRMVPVFGRDEPGVDADVEKRTTIVGLRMPYDIPLVGYGQNEVPWCNTMTHGEPDWKGRVWGGEDE